MLDNNDRNGPLTFLPSSAPVLADFDLIPANPGRPPGLKLQTTTSSLNYKPQLQAPALAELGPAQPQLDFSKLQDKGKLSKVEYDQI